MRPVKVLASLVCGLLLIVNSASAAPAKSLGDLNKIGRLTLPVLSAESGGKIFFLNYTEAEGAELWITDGTPAGTSLLKDINPGTGSSLPNSFAPATFGGQPGVYFIASTSGEGSELWKSDGTAVGTELVKDINPGASDGMSSGGIGLAQIITNPALSFAVFAADDGSNGRELWFSSDGTAGGTYLIDDLNPGAASSDPQDFEFISSIPALFYSANVAGLGREPYWTTGAMGSSNLVADINPGAGSSEPERFSFTSVGGKIVFLADDGGANGKELWQTDTVTTTIVSDLTPGVADSQITELVTMPSGKVMFSKVDITSLTSFNMKLYLTNGSAGGTVPFADLNCIPGTIFSLFLPVASRYTSIVNGHAVFPCQTIDGAANPFETFDSDMWVTDGTESTTEILKDIFPGTTSSFSLGSFFVSGGLGFQANDGVHGTEPWFTDGTNTGTTLIMDINPGEAGSYDPALLFYSLFFKNSSTSTAELMSVIVGKERKLYYTDGTAANTREIADQFSSGTSDSDADEYAALGAGTEVVFAAQHTAKGRELFITNGKKKGTKLLKNIFKSGDSNPEGFRKIGKGKLAFAATSPNHGREIWSTDGTKKGTRRIKDIFPGGDSSNPQFFAGKRKGKIFFSASNDTTGNELWITNGAKSGTKLVKDINPGSDSSSLQIDQGMVFKGRLFFAADDGVNGQELWVSDGTEAGTTLFLDIESGLGSSSPEDFVILGDRLLFSAITAADGTELWITDGTVAGTQQVKDINPGAAGSSIFSPVASDTVIFFVANNGATGSELWRSDGTSAGTFLVEDIQAGAIGSDISLLTALPGDKVVFAADDNVNGNEPWGASASAGSAVLLKDMEPGASGSFPSEFYRLPGRTKAVFQGRSSAEGREIWITDGSAPGTTLLADVQPGTGSSSPSSFYLKGRKLFFTAEVADTGGEPFVLVLP